MQNAALELAHITTAKKSSKSSANDTGALWLTNGFADAPEVKAPDLFAPVDAQEGPKSVESAPTQTPKRGVVGEQSTLARGHGLVWDIRRALGRQRVHGLGWTREQLAFVLKLSVVGVRKMEHLGTSPIKSLEARRKLLELSKLLEQPGAEICAYIEREEKTLG